MEKTYGNRIPSGYRWAIGSLVVVPLIFLVAAAFGGLLNPLTITMITVLGLAFVTVYWKAGTMISADADSVFMHLPPLWRKRVFFKDIDSIAVEPIKPIEREWGNRGSLKRDGEIFVDAGHSRICLAFYLADDKVIRLGISSLEHGYAIAEVLESLKEESATALD